MSDASKICTRCNLEKPVDQFYYQNGKPKSVCKACTISRITKNSSTEEGRYIHAQAVAKNRKKAWLINKEDYIYLIRQPCFYCNDLLDSTNKTGIRLDRLDNSKGYIIGNIISCCTFCNYLRGDLLTPDETKALVNLLISMRQSNTQRVA
jgi:hypothetical protein